MLEHPSSELPTAARVQASLHELARLLREAHHLEPEAQQALADLVDELGKALDPADVPSAEMAHVADTAAQLAHALHQRQDTSVLLAARDRLEAAALRAEAEAPVTAGIVRRLLDTLANLGI
jgi:hypothetical protein